jgi:uncharacterized protein (DUF1778 family)
MNEQERKSNMLRIRMTEDVRELLDAAAQSEGQDTSSWARGVLIRSARRKMTTVTATWTQNES